VLARICVRRGEAARAGTLFDQGIRIFKEREIVPRVAETAQELGLLLRAQGAHAKATKYLALALDYANRAAGENNSEVFQGAET
jgi:hypothetical protein